MDSVILTNRNDSL